MIKRKTNLLAAVIIVSVSCLLIAACNENQKKVKKTVVVHKERKAPPTITYSFTNAKHWLDSNKTDSLKLNIVLAINRTDAANISKLDSILVPANFNGDVEYYLPFPLSVDALIEVNKIIFFSYPAQIFAAYENGELVYTGPTNMGRKADPTPTGLFFTNWKAEQTTSTFNDEWDLKWNFNIENKLGVGFHEYALPGYPASHSCLRLQEKDAKYLYNWADQWELDDKETVRLKGTPVVVFGKYNFDAPKPWLQLVSDSKALNITDAQLTQLSTPYLPQIMQEQAKRDAEAAH